MEATIAVGRGDAELAHPPITARELLRRVPRGLSQLSPWNQGISMKLSACVGSNCSRPAVLVPRMTTAPAPLCCTAGNSGFLPGIQDRVSRRRPPAVVEVVAIPLPPSVGDMPSTYTFPPPATKSAWNRHSETSSKALEDLLESRDQRLAQRLCGKHEGGRATRARR